MSSAAEAARAADHPDHARDRLRIFAALAAVYLIWGSTYLAIRIALDGFPPFTMGAIRFTVAGIGLFLWLRATGTPIPSRLQMRNAAATGVMLLAGGNGLVCYAEQSVSSGLAAVAVASVSLFAALFSGLYGRWPARLDWFGLAIGFAGIVMLNLGGDLRASPAGAAALICATIAWAFGSVWSRHRDMPTPWISTALQMIAGGIALTAIALLRGERIAALPSTHALAAIAYLIVAGSIAGFTAYVYLLGRVRPALATSYAYVNPPVAVLIGVLLGGERISAFNLIAMGVILAGVVVILLAKR